MSTGSRWGAGWLVLALALAGGGCDGCGGSAALRVEEPHPHVRCMAAEPPEERELRAGEVKATVTGRTLRVDAGPSPLRVAAFAGPAPGRSVAEATLAAVAKGEPDLILLLGGAGDDEGTAVATLRALGAIEAVTVALAGGRDDAAVLDAAHAELPAAAAERVVDARPLWRVVAGEHELALVSGAPRGRYARTEASCGYGEEALDSWLDALGEPPAGGRSLVSWAAPEGWPGSTGLAGVAAGDPLLADRAKAAGASGGLYAWPAVAPRPGGAQGVWRVPALRPRPAPGRAAAAPAARVLWLELGPEGLGTAGANKEESPPSASP